MPTIKATRKCVMAMAVCVAFFPLAWVFFVNLNPHTQYLTVYNGQTLGRHILCKAKGSVNAAWQLWNHGFDGPESHADLAEVLEYNTNFNSKQRAFINKIIDARKAGPLDVNMLKNSLAEFSEESVQARSILLYEAISGTDVLLDIKGLDEILAARSDDYKTVYIIEWTGRAGDCGGATNSRLNHELVENAKYYLDKVGVTNYIFLTYQDSCYDKIKEIDETIPILSAQDVIGLWPRCFRDPHSEVRVVVNYEILKRGYSIMNIDSDVILFRPVPKADMDSDIAFSQYVGPDYPPFDIDLLWCEGALNFGVWWWKNSQNGLRMYSQYHRRAVLDPSGQVWNGETWFCDDQDAFKAWFWANQHQFHEVRARDQVIKPNKKTEHTATMRWLAPEAYSMASRWFRGWDTKDKDKLVILHMATYGYSKQWGMREALFWQGDPPSYYQGKFLYVPRVDYDTFKEEREHLVKSLAIATILNRTLILNQFQCAHVPFVKFVEPHQKLCDYNFQYEWEMLEAEFPFKESSFIRNQKFLSTLEPGDVACIDSHDTPETRVCQNIFPTYGGVKKAIFNERNFLGGYLQDIIGSKFFQALDAPLMEDSKLLIVSVDRFAHKYIDWGSDTTLEEDFFARIDRALVPAIRPHGCC